MNPQMKLQKMGKYMEIIEKQNNSIAELSRRMNPNYVHNSYVSSIRQQAPLEPGDAASAPIDIADSSDGDSETSDEENEHSQTEDEDDNEAKSSSENEDDEENSETASKSKEDAASQEDDENISQKDHPMNGPVTSTDQQEDDQKMADADTGSTASSEHKSSPGFTNSDDDIADEDNASKSSENASFSSTEKYLRKSSALHARSLLNAAKLKTATTKILAKPPEQQKHPHFGPPRSKEGDY